MFDFSKLTKRFLHDNVPLELGQKIGAYFHDLESFARDGQTLLLSEEITRYRKQKRVRAIVELLGAVRYWARDVQQVLPAPLEPPKVPDPSATVVAGDRLADFTTEFQRFVRSIRDYTRTGSDRELYLLTDRLIKAGNLGVHWPDGSWKHVDGTAHATFDEAEGYLAGKGGWMHWIPSPRLVAIPIAPIGEAPPLSVASASASPTSATLKSD
jgi:hypothetical protein